MKGLRLKTCASVYDFLKHNVREEVWAYTVFRALDIANYRSSYCSDAKGRFRFTLTVPETDSASAHAFDVEFTNSRRRMTTSPERCAARSRLKFLSCPAWDAVKSRT